MVDLALLLVAVLLVGACGVFVAAEFSFITVNRATVEHLAARGDKPAQGILIAIKSLSTQLSGAQVGISITSLVIGLLTEPLLSARIEPVLLAIGLPDDVAPAVAAVLGIAIATMVTMVFGELVPKYLGIAKPLGLARIVQGPARLFSRLVSWPIRFLNGSANLLVRQFGVEPQEELASARSADEITSLVRRSAEQGTLPQETATMLERSLTFGELTALDVMTPRMRMKTLEKDEPVSHALALVRATGFSRFPVIDGDLDHVVGVVHVKQALGVPKTKRAHVKVAQIMKPPIVVPSSIGLDPLLATLRQGGMQLAIVVDEFGGTDGVVTMEDLIEELVGEVYDEHDRSRTAIRKLSKGGWVLSGLLRPDEIGEELGVFLPEEEEFETVGGLVAHYLERVPAVGDEAQVTAVDRDGNKLLAGLKVERMDGRRVDRLHMDVTPVEAPEAETA
jgi:CBS domain containing-hemolysin-like protein